MREETKSYQDYSFLTNSKFIRDFEGATVVASEALLYTFRDFGMSRSKKMFRAFDSESPENEFHALLDSFKKYSFSEDRKEETEKLSEFFCKKGKIVLQYDPFCASGELILAKGDVLARNSLDRPNGDFISMFFPQIEKTVKELFEALAKEGYGIVKPTGLLNMSLYEVSEKVTLLGKDALTFLNQPSPCFF